MLLMIEPGFVVAKVMFEKHICTLANFFEIFVSRIDAHKYVSLLLFLGYINYEATIILKLLRLLF